MTLLIKNVQVLVSNRKHADTTDVFVSGDTISAIGDFSSKKADETIDGQGCYLAPGFIDVYTTSDHHVSFFHHPVQDDFLRQGVTTIIGGYEGASLAPLLYGNLEALEGWSDPGRFNIDWHTLSELFVHLERAPLGVNFGTLIGFTTIRRAIAGPVSRALTKNERAVFVKLLTRSLDEGGFGLSVDDALLSRERIPRDEVTALLKLVAAKHALYAPSISKRGPGLSAALTELAKNAKAMRLKTVASVTPKPGGEDGYAMVLAKQNENENVRFTLPGPGGYTYPLYRLLPEWAQTGDLSAMRERIENEKTREKIVSELPEQGAGKIRIIKAPHHDSLVGRTVHDYRAMHALRDDRTALMKLMRTVGLRAVLFELREKNEGMVKLLSTRSDILLGSRGWSASRQHGEVFRPKAFDAFTSYLASLPENDRGTSESALENITRVPAKFLNLDRRGEIAEGNVADLTGFKGGTIHFTVVNGRVAFKNGEATHVRAGRVLRHRAVAPRSVATKQSPERTRTSALLRRQ